MIATDDKRLRHPLPPRLTMDEYVVWIQSTLQQADPVKAARQKAIQEQITVPFRLDETMSGIPHPAPTALQR
jgi:hypothetical protein